MLVVLLPRVRREASTGGAIVSTAVPAPNKSISQPGSNDGSGVDAAGLHVRRCALCVACTNVAANARQSRYRCAVKDFSPARQSGPLWTGTINTLLLTLLNTINTIKYY